MNPGENYRLLNSNEIIRAGDEYYIGAAEAWFRVSDSEFGYTVKDINIKRDRWGDWYYRRPLTDNTAVVAKNLSITKH